MVLDKISVLGCPSDLDNSGERAYCACSRCGWGLSGQCFLSSVFSPSSLWEATRYRLKYCLKGPLSQPRKKLAV